MNNSTPYSNQRLNTTYHSHSLSLSPQIQSDRKLIPRHIIHHDRQRSELIISELRRQIDSINHVIDQSRILINSDIHSKVGRHFDNAEITTPRNNQKAPTVIRHSQGRAYTPQQFPIYLNSQQSVKYDATTTMKPKLNITISYNDIDAHEIRKSHQVYFPDRNEARVSQYPLYQDPSKPIQKIEASSKIEAKHTIPKIAQPIITANRNQAQMQELRRKQMAMEKKAIQAQSLYQKSRTQNQYLKEQIKNLEKRRSIQKQVYQRKIKQLQKVHDNVTTTVKTNDRQVVKRQTIHKKAKSDYKKVNQKTTSNSSNNRAFSYLQQYTGNRSRYYPYDKYRSKSKSNIRYHSPVVDLGSVELSKTEKAKFNTSKQKITFKDNHPYFSNNRSNINSRQQRIHSRSNSFDYHVGSVSRQKDNKYANQRASQLSSRLLESRRKKQKGIKLAKNSTESVAKQQTSRPATNQAYLAQTKLKHATNSPYKQSSIKSSYAPTVHNCSLSMKTTFQEFILPKNPPTKNQFKNAVLKHYIVNYYLNDDDLNDLYSKVASGNVPQYEWAVLALQAAYQKVHNSAQLPKVYY